MMEQARWERVQELFAAAVEIEAARRQSFLEEACAGDMELLAELKSLLAGDDHAGHFLEIPALEISGGMPESTCAYGQLA